MNLKLKQRVDCATLNKSKNAWPRRSVRHSQTHRVGANAIPLLSLRIKKKYKWRTVSGSRYTWKSFMCAVCSVNTGSGEDHAKLVACTDSRKMSLLRVERLKRMTTCMRGVRMLLLLSLYRPFILVSIRAVLPVVSHRRR